MDDKITMTRLAAMLAISTGKQKKLCEDFLRELFAVVEEELLKGENVRIKGFGTFKLVDVEPRKSVNVYNGEETIIPGHSKVLFVAAKELASRVNLPFEAFEAVEIADELPTDSFEGGEDPIEESIPDVVEQAEPIDDADSAVASVNEIEDEEESETYQHEEDKSEIVQHIEGETPNKESDVDQEMIYTELRVGSEEEAIDDEASLEAYSSADKEEDDAAESGDEDCRCHNNHRFAKGFVAGFVAALIGGGIVFAIGYLLGFTFGVSKGERMAEEVLSETVNAEVVVDSVVSVLPLEEDSVIANAALTDNGGGNGEDVPTKASDEPTYDTVSTTRYLTTIAKEHYGNFNLWPIIYEENKDILGHPDRIRPGTKVVVPPLSKYGIDPKNAAQIKEIKQKGIEIYARFK